MSSHAAEARRRPSSSRPSLQGALDMCEEDWKQNIQVRCGDIQQKEKFKQVEKKTSLTLKAGRCSLQRSKILLMVNHAVLQQAEREFAVAMDLGSNAPKEDKAHGDETVKESKLDRLKDPAFKDLKGLWKQRLREQLGSQEEEMLKEAITFSPEMGRPSILNAAEHNEALQTVSATGPTDESAATLLCNFFSKVMDRTVQQDGDTGRHDKPQPSPDGLAQTIATLCHEVDHRRMGWLDLERSLQDAVEDVSIPKVIDKVKTLMQASGADGINDTRLRIDQVRRWSASRETDV